LLQDPSLAFAYCDHTDRVKVAKFAPTGKYIASGDAVGRVRVWAFTQAEHSLKYELPSIGGEVEDLAWDGESKRILVVGGGSAKAKVRSGCEVEMHGESPLKLASCGCTCNPAAIVCVLDRSCTALARLSADHVTPPRRRPRCSAILAWLPPR